MFDEERVQIIKDIIDNFGVFNANIILPLQRGESLADFLKGYCVIYPIEYDALLTANTNTFGDFADSLTRITTLIRSKQKLYNLYLRYCEYFLGEYVSYTSLDSCLKETHNHFNLRDENGRIDYKPYLEALGITDLQHISEQYPGRGR